MDLGPAHPQPGLDTYIDTTQQTHPSMPAGPGAQLSTPDTTMKTKALVAVYSLMLAAAAKGGQVQDKFAEYEVVSDVLKTAPKNGLKVRAMSHHITDSTVSL